MLSQFEGESRRSCAALVSRIVKLALSAQCTLRGRAALRAAFGAGAEVVPAAGAHACPAEARPLNSPQSPRRQPTRGEHQRACCELLKWLQVNPPSRPDGGQGLLLLLKHLVPLHDQGVP